jgi:hypothetical protein
LRNEFQNLATYWKKSWGQNVSSNQWNVGTLNNLLLRFQ